MSNESEKLNYEINQLRKQIKLVNLDSSYIPNTIPHQEKWVPNKEIVENAFTADIGEGNIEEIMHLNVEKIIIKYYYYWVLELLNYIKMLDTWKL